MRVLADGRRRADAGPGSGGPALGGRGGARGSRAGRGVRAPAPWRERHSVRGERSRGWQHPHESGGWLRRRARPELVPDVTGGRRAAAAAWPGVGGHRRPGAGRGNRFVVRRGRLEPLPLSPPALLRSRLFSTRAKLRALMEPLVRRSPPEEDESVASFARRRLAARCCTMRGSVRVRRVRRRSGAPVDGARVPTPPRTRADARVDRAGDDREASPGEERWGDCRLRDGATGELRKRDGDADRRLEASLAGTLRLSCPVRLLHRSETRWEVERAPTTHRGHGRLTQW
jgi:hypothetical protein